MAAEVDGGRTTELLLSLARDGARPLGAQIEDGLRAAIRTGTLKPGAAVPSTRDLARQLGVSRGLVLDAYAQLGAEGYLVVRQGARPRVAAAPGEEGGVEEPAPRLSRATTSARRCRTCRCSRATRGCAACAGRLPR